MDLSDKGSILDYIKKYNQDLIDSYDFSTKIGKELDPTYVKKCEKVLERGKYVIMINEYIENIKHAEAVESGIFEYSLVYCKINSFEDMVYAVYNDKAKDIIHHFKQDELNNKALLKRLEKNEIDPKSLAFLNPMQLYPENWEFYNRKKNLRKYKEDNLAATDNYTCYKCKEKKCKVTQMQTRSADEPITNFVVCLSCGNTWKC
jgi:DNA-directed RNA polymerase subunit M/transcription elongation factor TFIIS